MRPISDQNFYWATRRSTPVHLRALKGRADELRQDGPKPVRGIQQVFSFWSHHAFSQSHQRAHRLGELFCQTNCESPCSLQEDILYHCGALPTQHNSQATLSKMRENVSWMAVNDNVNLACSHNCRRTPRFSGMQNGFPLGWTLVIAVFALICCCIPTSST